MMIKVMVMKVMLTKVSLMRVEGDDGDDGDGKDGDDGAFATGVVEQQQRCSSKSNIYTALLCSASPLKGSLGALKYTAL